MKNDTAMVRPICYMIMPFRRKKVEEPRPTGAPAEINFDALWETAYWPAIEALGYLPMRADFDPRSAIVKAMLERIAFADLVLADVTLGNANVYYEVGYAHALNKPTILLAQRGKELPFDIRSYRVIFYDDSIGGKPLVEKTLREHLHAILQEI